MLITGNLAKSEVSYSTHTEEFLTDYLIFNLPSMTTTLSFGNKPQHLSCWPPMGMYFSTQTIPSGDHMDFINLRVCLTNRTSNSHFTHTPSKTHPGQCPRTWPASHLPPGTAVTDKIGGQELPHMAASQLRNNEAGRPGNPDAASSHF